MKIVFSLWDRKRSSAFCYLVLLSCSAGCKDVTVKKFIEMAPSIKANNSIPSPFPSLFSTPVVTGSDQKSTQPTFSFALPPTNNNNASVHKTQTEDREIDANEEDDHENTTPEEPTLVLHEENTEEDILLECEAKHGKFVDNQWKLYAAGTLRLYRHRMNPIHQKMVIRNSMGKVQLNLGIFKGMKLAKTVSKKKGSITFLAVEDAHKGLERFTLMVKKEDVDMLHTTLENMAK
jgi:hypothetical protein